MSTFLFAWSMQAVPNLIIKTASVGKMFRPACLHLSNYPSEKNEHSFFHPWAKKKWGRRDKKSLQKTTSLYYSYYHPCELMNSWNYANLLGLQCKAETCPFGADFCISSDQNKSLQRSGVHSCSRDWRLSASWGPDWCGSQKPLEHHDTIVLRGLSGGINWSPIMPRSVSLSDSRCKFFQSGFRVFFLWK